MTSRLSFAQQQYAQQSSLEDRAKNFLKNHVIGRKSMPPTPCCETSTWQTPIKLKLETFFIVNSRRNSANMEADEATQTITDLHLVMDEKGETLSLSEATHAGVEQLQAYEPKDEDDTAGKINTWKSCPWLRNTPSKACKRLWQARTVSWVRYVLNTARCCAPRYPAGLCEPRRP